MPLGLQHRVLLVAFRRAAERPQARLEKRPELAQLGLGMKGRGLDTQLGHLFVGDRRNPAQRRVVQKCAAQPVAHVLFHQHQPFGVHLVDFVQHHYPVPNPQALQHFEMFPGLRHDAFIGSVAPGQQCDLAIWDIQRPAELVYRLGFNPLHARIVKGVPA